MHSDILYEVGTFDKIVTSVVLSCLGLQASLATCCNRGGIVESQ